LLIEVVNAGSDAQANASPCQASAPRGLASSSVKRRGENRAASAKTPRNFCQRRTERLSRVYSTQEVQGTLRKRWKKLRRGKVEENAVSLFSMFESIHETP
jgi:hypothetical protein